MEDRRLTKVHGSTSTACGSTPGAHSQCYHLHTKTGSAQLDSTAVCTQTLQNELALGKKKGEVPTGFISQVQEPHLHSPGRPWPAKSFAVAHSTCPLPQAVSAGTSCCLDLHLTANQKNATDSFHRNHRNQSQLIFLSQTHLSTSHRLLLLLTCTSLS